MTGGRGPDSWIDAVGMEAHGTGPQYAFDRMKQALRLQTDRGQALREAVMACRKGGTLSALGVYGLIDKFPMDAYMTNSCAGTIHFRMGSTITTSSRVYGRTVRCCLENAIDPTRTFTRGVSRLMTDQHIMAVMFVMNTELVDQGGTCFVEALHVYLRTELAKFEHHLIQSADRSDVPEMRIGEIDVHSIRGFGVIERMYKLVRGGKEDLPCHLVSASAAVAFNLRADIQ